MWLYFQSDLVIFVFLLRKKLLKDPKTNTHFYFGGCITIVPRRRRNRTWSCSDFGFKVYPRYDNSVLRAYLRKKSVKQRSPWQRWGGKRHFCSRWHPKDTLQLGFERGQPAHLCVFTGNRRNCNQVQNTYLKSFSNVDTAQVGRL